MRQYVTGSIYHMTMLSHILLYPCTWLKLYLWTWLNMSHDFPQRQEAFMPEYPEVHTHVPSHNMLNESTCDIYMYMTKNVTCLISMTWVLLCRSLALSPSLYVCVCVLCACVFACMYTRVCTRCAQLLFYVCVCVCVVCVCCVRVFACVNTLCPTFVLSVWVLWNLYKYMYSGLLHISTYINLYVYMYIHM